MTTYNQFKDMDLKERIRVALGLEDEATEVKLAFEAKLADGTIIVSEADALAEGVVVNVLSEDGTQTPLPAGTFELEDGSTFTTDEAGVVTEVSAEEEVEEEAPADEVEEEEMSVEEGKAALFAEIGAVVKELLEEVKKDLDGLKAELEEVRNENLAKDENLADLLDENTNLSEQVKELNEQPAEKPVAARKFASEKKVQLSKAEYLKLSAQDKFLYNLKK